MTVLDDHLSDNSDNEEAGSRDRAIRLFEYLKRLAELRARTIRDLAEYTEVLWFREVPAEPECRAVTALRQPHDQTQGAGGAERWLVIERPRRSRPPEVPPVLAPWVDSRALEDSAGEPALLEDAELVTVYQGADGEVERAEPHRLTDHPEVPAAWARYRERWERWAAEDRRLKPVYQVYKRLFEVEQLGNHLGEQFETVVGLGLLTWAGPPGTGIVRRHLLTMPAEVAFDAETGRISLGPPADGARLSFEEDMLDGGQLPSRELKQQLDERLLEADPWDRANVDATLRAWVHAADTRGSFDPSLAPRDRADEAPQVSFAPALILRRRSPRSLIDFYAKAIGQLRDEAVTVPATIRDMIEILDDLDLPEPAPEPEPEPEPDPEGVLEADVEIEGLAEPVAVADGEVFFPLPSNDEQWRIVERLARHRGVIVQGPPGTGKSHTIANLISHLTALGKRVLVTSHTGRALEVLKGKLPPDIAQLCVSMVGDGRSGAGDLERSVQALVARATDPDWDEHAIETRVAWLRERLAAVAGERRELLDRQRAIRLREIEPHALPELGDGYDGKLAEIALRLRDEESRHGWLAERPELEAPPPLGPAEAGELLGLLRRLRGPVATRAAQAIPDAQALLQPGEVARRFEQLAAAEGARQADRLAAARALPPWGPLSAASDQQRRALVDALAALTRARDLALRGREPWLPVAASAVLEGHAGEWEELARLTREDLDALAEAIDEADASEVRGLDGLDPATLRGQARELADHLAAGGRTGGLLKAPAVRAARPLLDHARLDGLVPDTPELLARLMRVLDAEVGLARIERRWGSRLPGTGAARAAGGTANGKANGHARPHPENGQANGQRQGASAGPARGAAPRASAQATAYSIRRARLVDATTALQGVLALAGPRVAAEEAAQAVGGLIPPLWSDAARVQELARCLQALDAEREVAALTESIEAAAAAYRAASLQRGAAPECAYAASALHARDLAAYASAFAGIEEVADGSALAARRDALLARLRAAAPQLAAALERQPDDPAWDERLAELEPAWNWARAERWYRTMVNPAEERTLGERLRACDQRALKLTGELGANLAWRHCLARMSHKQSQHLRAYQTAMRRYGKGTGKHAPTHLAAAQRHMEACQDAVPAWIMPTYRVAETIPPRPHAFDVVIVDEASQSGVDALFLLWLAPKVVVVGDDRQISPDNIGVDRYVVERLQRQHLPDVELRDLLGLDNSLYDQTASRYRGRIWLQEHFRCMPEIIEFSNRLSYGDHLLVPLRQFGTDRLEPLRTAHVPNAITYGNDLGKINDDEAVAIVDRIARCCADPRYDGRSMGVVSLLGAAQAKRVHDLLVERIGPEEMVARRLKCGTAYDFQGDERSVMFLSMVVVPNPDGRPLPALGGRGSEQRFNVAASRAQDQLWLFHSVQPHDLNRECVRWKLLSHCVNPPPSEDLRQVAGEIDEDALQEPFETLFEQQVCRRLTTRGYRVVAQHRIHGFRVDLVVLGDRGRLGIVCDGDQWRGPDQYDHDLARQRALERCGWRFHHLRASEFSRDPDAALEPLWQLLTHRGITPTPADPERASAIRV